jgi:hypothetical protein
MIVRCSFIEPFGGRSIRRVRLTLLWATRRYGPPVAMLHPFNRFVGNATARERVFPIPRDGWALTLTARC